MGKLWAKHNGGLTSFELGGGFKCEFIGETTRKSSISYGAEQAIGPFRILPAPTGLNPRNVTIRAPQPASWISMRGSTALTETFDLANLAQTYTRDSGMSEAIMFRLLHNNDIVFCSWSDESYAILWEQTGIRNTSSLTLYGLDIVLRVFRVA